MIFPFLTGYLEKILFQFYSSPSILLLILFLYAKSFYKKKSPIKVCLSHTSIGLPESHIFLYHDVIKQSSFFFYFFKYISYKIFIIVFYTMLFLLFLFFISLISKTVIRLTFFFFLHLQSMCFFGTICSSFLLHAFFLCTYVFLFLMFLIFPVSYFFYSFSAASSTNQLYTVKCLYIFYIFFTKTLYKIYK